MTYRISEEVKRRVLELIRKGVERSVVMARLGISETSLKKILREAR